MCIRDSSHSRPPRIHWTTLGSPCGLASKYWLAFAFPFCGHDPTGVSKDARRMLKGLWGLSAVGLSRDRRRLCGGNPLLRFQVLYISYPYTGGGILKHRNMRLSSNWTRMLGFPPRRYGFEPRQALHYMAGMAERLCPELWARSTPVRLRILAPNREILGTCSSNGRAPDCLSGWCGFESSQLRHKIL